MNAKQAREQTDKAIEKNYDVSVYIEEIDILIDYASQQCKDSIHYDTSKNDLKIIEIKRIVYHYKTNGFDAYDGDVDKKGYISISW